MDRDPYTIHQYVGAYPLDDQRDAIQDSILTQVKDSIVLDHTWTRVMVPV